MSTKSVTDRTIRHPLIADVLDEQAGNFSGHHFDNKGAKKAVRDNLIDYARAVILICLQDPPPRPDLTNQKWRSELGDYNHAVVYAHGLDQIIDQAIDVLCQQFPKAVGAGRASFRYPYIKVALHVTSVASCILHNIDPELLRMTQEEADDALEHLADVMIEASKTVILVDGDGKEYAKYN